MYARPCASRARLVLSCLLLVASAAAQEPQPQALPRPAAGPAFAPDQLRVPLHVEHDPDGPALWAAGPGYKVRVGRAVEFHPRLGPAAPRGLPWHWRTEAVQVGEQALPLRDAPTVRHRDFHAEIDHGALTEVYDVLPEGVEQSFVLAAPPAGTGDLVIRGAVTTELTGAPVPAARQELVFRDARGDAVVTYGSALAIDAAGRRGPVTTSFDGTTIELRLPGAWLANAAFPLVVDPLVTGPQVMGGWPQYYLPETVDVASSGKGSGRTLLVAVTSAFSSPDTDVVVYACNPDFSNGMLVMSQISSYFRDTAARATAIYGALRWVVAYERNWLAGTSPRSAVLLYFHDYGATALNGGVGLEVPRLVPTERCTSPVLGGTDPATSATTGLLAFQTDLGVQGQQEIVTLPVDGAARTVGSTRQPVGGAWANGTLLRAEPAINDTGASGSTGWLVAWQERAAGVVNGSIVGSLFDAQGQHVASGELVAAESAARLREPRVAGSDGVFALTFGRSVSLASDAIASFAIRRVDWPGAAAAPVLGSAHVLTSGGGGNHTLYAGDLAFDRLTRSHWVASWRRHVNPTLPMFPSTTTGSVVRVGGTCKPIESQSLPGDWSRGLAVTYDRWFRRFPLAHLEDSPHTVTGAFLTYPDDAISVPYGTACGSALIAGAWPYAGNREFRLQATGAGANAGPALLAIAFGAGAQPLDALGMPGCTLLVDAATMLPTFVAVQNGSMSAAVPLPDDPVWVGDLHAQWFYAVPGANAFGLLATRALQVQVR